ncbi:SDR family NAD(P)-dependent oxidoreductase [Pseudolabrys sp. FHR47]|uniref:SDR family NAD(P)-dependent oxidoreductase n=1 Tax=Pseudolabrys sp. FHR47 TaxID=2562284 RepID=UPI0010BF11E9|nr:SDR family oxidoreductase [Pseudolabrys sp. FHR47]
MQRQAGRIDILVNNAGISGFSKPIEAIAEADVDGMFDTHVKGAIFFAKAVMPRMKQQRAGRIVNIASNFAMTGHDSMSHYVAAKSALLGLTKAWAREFAPFGITVNAVAPGLIATPLTRKSIGEAALEERGRAILLGRLRFARNRLCGGMARRSRGGDDNRPDQARTAARRLSGSDGADD